MELGGADISVAYKSINRKGRSDDRQLGRNDKSWSLTCSPKCYSALHNNKLIEIPAPSSRSSRIVDIPVPNSWPRRVGVYLD